MYTQACAAARARPFLLRRLLGGLLGRLLDRLARHETEARSRHRLARLEPQDTSPNARTVPAATVEEAAA